MAISLKINRLELISRLEAARAKSLSDYESDVARYEKEKKEKTKLALKMLKERLAKGDFKFQYYGVELEIRHKSLQLKSPNSKPSFTRLDEQLRNLKLATNETLTISDKSDYFKYL